MSALDVDAIAARAAALPGSWVAYPDMVRVPWSPATDDAPIAPGCEGRYLMVMANEWHAESDDVPPGLWEFLGSARDDVLALAAEVRRLRAELAARPAGPAPAAVALAAADGRRRYVPRSDAA